MRFVLPLFLLSFCYCYKAIAQDLNDLSYAELDSLMYIEYGKGSYDEAITYMQAGKEKAKKEFGTQDSVYANYTGNLAVFYNEKGAFQEAEKLYLETKEIRAKVLGKEHPDYASILNDFGTLYHDIGKYTLAESLYTEAKEIRAKVLGKEHPNYATSLDHLAGLYQDVGNYTDAEPLYLEAKKIRAKALGKKHYSYATSLNNLASLYFQMENYAQAEPILIETSNVYTATLGKNHPAYATSLNNLGGLYRNTGDYRKAQSLFKEALGIYANNFGKIDSKYAITLGNLAGVYIDVGSFAKAESLFEEVVKIQAKTLGKNHPSYATSLNNLAGAYRHLGKYKEAESLFIEAIDVYSRILGQEHPDYSMSLNNLAGLYLQIDSLDSALKYCIRGIDANSIEIDSNFTAFETLDQYDYYSFRYINASIFTLLKIIKAQYELTRKKTKLEQHYQLAQSAMRLNERIRNDFINEKNKLRTLRVTSEIVSQGIRTAYLLEEKSYRQEAFTFAELNKSILLADAIKGNRARTFGDLPDSLAEKERLLQNELMKLKSKQFNTQAEIENDQNTSSLGELNLEIKSFLKSLKGKYPQYHALKYENIIAKVDDVQALLDEKTLLLEFFQTDSTLYLFSLNSTKLDLFPIQLARPVLKEKIGNLRRALSDYKLIEKDEKEAYRLYTETAHWFYKNLLKIAFKDKNVEHLIIITDGELGHLPFETFLVEPAPQGKKGYNNLHYLFNEYKITYSYSATLWKENLKTKRIKSNGEILACAAKYTEVDSMVKDIDSPHLFRLRGALKPLPFAKEEVLALEEKFRGDFLFEESANERFFKANAHKYGIIHLAMHGVLDTLNPMLSSLAFTENRDSREDDFLQAYEISRLKMNADLVVLSACETGYGTFEQGQGIISLARSFMYAGTPSLVVSLWNVDDASTASIMGFFYENLASGMDKASALREAKLSYIYSAFGPRAHPAFWSPFIQLGDYRPIEIAPKNNALAFWIGGGLLSVLLIGGLMLKLRSKKQDKHF